MFLIERIFLLTSNSIHTSKIRHPSSYKRRENHKPFKIDMANTKNVHNECKNTNTHENKRKKITRVLIL